MRINSSIVTQVPMGVTGGGEVDLPEIVLPTIAMRMPMLAVATGAGIDLRKVEASTFASRSINQGASTAPSSVSMVTLDKGVYHIIGGLIGATFGALAPSSAALNCANVDLLTPQGSAGGILASVGYDGAGTPFSTNFEITVFLTQTPWTLRLTSFLNTGVGQSLGCTAWATVSKLL